MTPTEIRTAPYMTLEAEKETGIISSRVYVKKVEFYKKEKEWYVIGYYSDNDEYSEVLSKRYIPNGWLDTNQAISRYIEEQAK